MEGRFLPRENFFKFFIETIKNSGRLESLHSSYPSHELIGSYNNDGHRTTGTAQCYNLTALLESVILWYRAVPSTTQQSCKLSKEKNIRGHILGTTISSRLVTNCTALDPTFNEVAQQSQPADKSRTTVQTPNIARADIDHIHTTADSLVLCKLQTN